jgi:hypothetical protein
MTKRLAVLAALGVLGSTGCAITALTDLVDPPGSDTPSLIIFYGDTASIIAPDTVSSGVPFDVTFATFRSMCEEIKATDVMRMNRAALIRPFERNPVGYTHCDDVPSARLAVVQVRLEARGAWLLRLTGAQRDSEHPTNTPAAITRRVIVK